MFYHFGLPYRYCMAMFLRRQGAKVRLIRCRGGVCALWVIR
jgi:hypothetical protein